jgi:hypothetical protein
MSTSNLTNGNHNWVKSNLVSNKKGNDTYKCTLCGMEVERMGISEKISSTKYSAEQLTTCEKVEVKVSKIARKVGDIHPKHSNWIWTEYAAGKFDYRINSADKKQGQRTDKKESVAKPSKIKK